MPNAPFSHGSLRALATVVIGASLALTHEASAQFTSAIDLSSRTARPGQDTWSSQLAVSPFARFDHPRVSLEGRWTAFGSEGQRLNGFGNLGATYYTPSLAGFQFSVAGFADRSLLNESYAVSRFGTDTRLSYRFANSGTWVGREISRDNKSTPISPVPAMSAGAWHQWSNAIITFAVSSFGSHYGNPGGTRVVERVRTGAFSDTGQALDTISVPDSSKRRGWNDAELAMHWGAGRFAFRGVVGSRFATADQPNEVWGSVQSTVSLTPSIALIATGGIHPSSAAYGISRARFVEVGFRVAPTALLRPRLPASVRPVAAVFEVAESELGKRTLRIRVPNARTVELSGDFTNWQPISLTRASDDRWETTMAITPGMHRLAIRVDGDTWSPPPGVSSVKDEFQGNVGVIVVK